MNVMSKIEALDANKSISGNIPTKIKKEVKEVICPYLTDCINATMEKCCFPNTRQDADISAIHKKDDKCRRVNYRPISVLSSMSKIMSEQITQYLLVYHLHCSLGFDRDTAHTMLCFELVRLGKSVSMFRVQ